MLLRILLLLVVSVTMYFVVTTAAKTLVWSDEFDGPEVDRTKWNFANGNANGWGSQELQYYTDRHENVRIDNGMLVIEALKELYKGFNYTSGRIFSKNKADFLYGRMEIRAKLPKGQGLWPAIWMYPSKYVHGPGIASGEIDIMELLGHQPQIMYTTVHYGKTWTDRGSKHGHYTLAKGKTFEQDFHVFALDWTQDGLVFWVDDHQVMTFNRSDVPSEYVYPFDAEFYFILNVAVGGNWPKPPNTSTIFPQRMYVDYVRVYQ